MAKEFTYKIKLDAEIATLEKQLQSAKTALKDALDSGEADNLAKALETIDKKIESLKTKANTPAKGESAFTAIQKDIAGVKSGLDSLDKKIQATRELTNSQKISLLPEDQQKILKEAAGAMEAYAQTIDDAENGFKKLSKANKNLTEEDKTLIEVLKKLTDANKKVEDATQKVQEAQSRVETARKVQAEAKANKENAEAIKASLKARQEDAKAAKEELAQAEAAATKWKAAHANEKFDARKSFTDDNGTTYNVSQAKAKVTKTAANVPSEEEIDQATEAYKRYAAAYDAATASVGRAENAQTKANTALEQTETAARDAQVAFEKLKTDKTQAAFTNLKNKAQELNISLDGIGDGSKEDIELLTERFQSFVAEGVEPANVKLSEASDCLLNAKLAADSCSEATDRNAESFKAEDEAVGQVNGFVTRIKQFTGLAGAAVIARRAISSAFSTIKELDEQMTEMAVVTDLDVGDYWNQLASHTEAANQLGVAIKDVYEAETLYYQQGLKTTEVEQVATSTLKMARIAGLSAEDATNKMTAALRGFNMEINETNADRVADVYSKLAAITASDVNEISSAMTKTASLAASAGMEFETTAAFLSQIIETTRESAETAGTALKTVIARFQELKKSPDEIGEVDGEIIDANKIETALRSVGVALRDTQGQFRDLDDVFLELSSKWDTLDTNTQRYIATIAAGSRQQSRFIAMMQDYSRTQELVSAANNSAGASNEQFEKTLESLESKLEQLSNAWDTFTMGLANNEFIKLGIDLLTGFLNTINKITEGFDSWSGSALKIGVVVTALMAGDKALKVFTTSFKATQSVMKSFSAIGTASIKSIKDEITSLGTIVQSVFKKGTWIQNAGALSKLVPKIDSKDLKDIESLVKTYKSVNQSFSEGTSTLDDTNKAFNDVIGKMNDLGIATNATSEQQTAFMHAIQNGNTIEQASVLLKDESAAKSYLEAEAVGVETAAEELCDKTRRIGLLTRAKATLALLFGNQQARLNAMYTLGMISAEQKEDLMNKKVTASQLGLNAAFYASPIGWIALAVLALVAALTALVVIIVKTEKAASATGQLEAATEKLEAATEVADEATEAYNNLTDSLESLNDTYDELDNLIIGTQKWRDALLEVNQQVMDLIDQYPQLAASVEIDSNGVMRLNEEAQKQIEIQQAATVAQANNAQIQATIERNQAKNTVAYSNLSDTAISGNQTGATWAGIGAGAAAGSKLGASAGLWGQAIGSIAGAVVGGIKSREISREQNRETTDQLAQAIAAGKINIRNEDGSINTDALEKYAVEIMGMEADKAKEWIEELDEESLDALREYGETLNTNAKAEEASLKTMISNSIALLDINKYTTEQLAQMANIGTKTMEDTIAAQKAALDAQSGKNDLKDDTEYLEYWESIYGVGNVKIGDNGKVKVKNDEGKFEEKVTAESARSQYATAKATEDYTDKLELLPKVLAKAGTGVEGLNKALNKAYNDDTGEGLSESDLRLLDEEHLKNLWNTNKELREIYGDNEEGYAEFIKLMNERTGNAQSMFQQVNDSMDAMGLDSEMFKDLDLTASAKKGLIDQLSQVVAVSGEETANALGATIDNILGKVAEDDREGFISQLNAVDWHDANAVDGLKDTIKELGYDAGMTNEELDDFIEELKTSAHAVATIDLTELNEQLNGLAKILKKIRTGAQDRIFEESDYESIIAANADLINDFVKDEEGQYHYLGTSMQTLTEAINKNTSAQIKTGLDLLDNQINAANLLDTYATFTYEGEKKQFSAKSMVSEDDTDVQREFLQVFIDNAKSRGYNLDGISTKLTTKTDASNKSVLSDDDIQQIIEDIAQYEGAQKELEKEQDTNEIQLIINQALTQDVSTNVKDYQNTTDRQQILGYSGAIITQAQNAGISEVDLARAEELRDTMADMSENDERFEQYNSELESLIAIIGNKTAYNTALTGMKSIVDEVKTLTDSYDEAVSNEERMALVSQMVEKFGIKVTSSNYKQLKSYIDAWQQGSTEAYGELINLSGKAKGASDDVFEALSKDSLTYEQAIESSSEELVEFLINSGLAISKTSHDTNGNVVRSFQLMTEECINYTEQVIEKTEEWESAYDWLWLMNKKISTEIAKRNKLEWEYKQLLDNENATTDEILNNLSQQRESLIQQNQELQNSFANLRKELNSYVASVPTAFSAMLTYDNQGNISGLDLNAINDADFTNEEGELFDKFIDQIESYLDEMTNQIEDAIDLKEYYDTLKNTGKDEYADLLNRITTIMTDERQAEIDKLTTINDTIAEASDALVSKLQEKIDDDKQARENDEAEQSIVDKQQQLAYLMASGGSQVEILALQEEIADAQESYTDSLTSQAIQDLTDINTAAADQRQQQIDLAQSQLDWWKEHDATADAETSLNNLLSAGGNALAEYLNTETDNLSTTELRDWYSSLEASTKAAEIWQDEVERLITGSGTSNYQLYDEASQLLDEDINKMYAVYASLSQAKGTNATTRDAKHAGEEKGADLNEEYEEVYKQEYGIGYHEQELQALIDDAQSFIDEADLSASKKRYAQKWIAKLQQKVIDEPDDTTVEWLQQKLNAFVYSKKYATGGLADYTGPAWLDGTPSAPELVLNQTDTANFIELKNILADIMRGAKDRHDNKDAADTGNNYYNIDVAVDSLESDYDVDQVVERIKELIINDANYRNVYAVEQTR